VGYDFGWRTLSSRAVRPTVFHPLQLLILKMMHSSNQSVWGHLVIPYLSPWEIMKWSYIWRNCKLHLISMSLIQLLLVLANSCFLRVYTTAGQRLFNVTIEDTFFGKVDIFKLAGAGQQAAELTAYPLVTDGNVTITFTTIANFDQPCVSAIEVKRSLPHLAHAVANGPYHAVDITNTNSGIVYVDGTESHTHGPGLTLTNWTWTKGPQILGRREVTSFTLPVGTHAIVLTVIDSGGNVGTDEATVVVSSFGYPAIFTLTPSSGNITGGNVVTISGTGFSYSSNLTKVYFGGVVLTGSAVTILDSSTITVVAPLMPLSVPVKVSIETPLGRSDEATYTYTSSTPIAFTESKLMDFASVTVGEFGPDGKLYVGTVDGTVGKITMNADYTTVISSVTSSVQPGRAILGITFDPMDAGAANPPVYITSTELFHGEVLSSSGKAINGKICRISGANLDVVTNVITGLPVSDLDHCTFECW
jgi:IPT/TIG domain